MILQIFVLDRNPIVFEAVIGYVSYLVLVISSWASSLIQDYADSIGISEIEGSEFPVLFSYFIS